MVDRDKITRKLVAAKLSKADISKIIAGLEKLDKNSFAVTKNLDKTVNGLINDLAFRAEFFLDPRKVVHNYPSCCCERM